MSAANSEHPAPELPALRMPAEWHPQAAIWLVWPHAPDTWPGALEAASDEFEGFVRAIAECEPVELLVTDEPLRDRVERRLSAESSLHPVRLHIVPSDDSWVRDTGPTFALDADGRLAALDWRFNAWGGKYPPWDRDAAVARRIAEIAGAERISVPLTLEGGALEVDGEGTLLANRSCVFDPARNGQLTEAEIEPILGRLLGVERFLWVQASLTGDDTDGHIDNLARFVAPGRIACSVPDERDHPDAAPLRALFKELSNSSDARGRALEVIELPLPPRIDHEGRRLPASYANFLILTDAVVVPHFGCSSDARADAILADCFPTRRIIGVTARTLVRGFGGPHCLSQQQPHGTTRRTLSA